MAHILIAEDERDIRELLKFTLQFAGHTITEAANGAEAVDLATAKTPDLIMTDVRMPRMTGYEVCRALKKIDTVKDIPVIILTARGQDEEVAEGMDAGAVDYITKPFGAVELTERIAEILQELGIS